MVSGYFVMSGHIISVLGVILCCNLDLVSIIYIYYSDLRDYYMSIIY